MCSREDDPSQHDIPRNNSPFAPVYDRDESGIATMPENWCGVFCGIFCDPNDCQNDCCIVVKGE